VVKAEADNSTEDPAAAADELEAAVAADPDDMQARRDLALALVAAGEYDAAIEQYEVMVKNDPTDGALLAEMASLEQRAGKARDAALHLEAAIKEEPAEPAYYLSLAPIRVSLGDWAAAIEVWTEYLEVGKPDAVRQAEIHAAMASAYDGMKDYANAQAELEQAISLDPDNADYTVRLEGYAN
ncbi:MAG: tetratricopeptide repeat protein, partial [Actinobacteria bacterium]|nr:tetratricopeptide repeat protein [Actinomycetota bacterium]